MVGPLFPGSLPSRVKTRMGPTGLKGPGQRGLWLASATMEGPQLPGSYLPLKRAEGRVVSGIPSSPERSGSGEGPGPPLPFRGLSVGPVSLPWGALPSQPGSVHGHLGTSRPQGLCFPGPLHKEWSFSTVRGSLRSVGVPSPCAITAGGPGTPRQTPGQQQGEYGNRPPRL